MKVVPAVLLAFLLGSSIGSASAAAGLQGTVLETIDAAQYTYLRLKTANGEVWAAVTHADVKKGAQVTIQDPMVMTNFESKTLNRKFDKIVFGTLGGTAAAAPAGMPMPPSAVQMATPGIGAGAPHPAAAPADVAVVKVPRAPGADGRTVAELYAQRAKLKDKPVVVHGAVVKFLPSIMGKNWVHLRDGTGSAADGSNDLVVTTMETAKAGDVISVHGTVRTDIDLGMGYSYKVIVENASLQK
jgi:hypothetical protein